MKYAYKIIDGHGDKFPISVTAQLNELGREGWRLIDVESGWFVMERELRRGQAHQHLLVDDFCSTCDRHISQMEQLGG